ncbi:MAG: DDE-type integrase/transposase/recombinase [Bacteroidota bacterium]
MVDRLVEVYQVSKRQVLAAVGLPTSSYYYQSKAGRKGRLPSATTWHKQQGWVNNQAVVKQIEAILSEPFQDYWGYHNVTAELRDQGYRINSKKVYRLMKEHRLLHPSTRLRPKVNRQYVKFRKIKTNRPLQYVEMDIKYVWVPDQGKCAYLLTLLDVHTRKVLAHQLAWNLKHQQVIDLFATLRFPAGIDQGQFPAQTIIRSDNGSQFIAQRLREYLALMGLVQEFTHSYTRRKRSCGSLSWHLAA